MKILERLLNNKPTNSVDILVAEYLTRLKDGEEVDYSQFIADNPEVAIELNSALRSQLDLRNINPAQKADKWSNYRQPASVSLASSQSSARSSSLLGTSVGNFTIESKLGQGGMATVYKAWQESCKRHVAIKTILADKLLTEALVKRLQREAMVQAQLRHPNIVQIYTCEIVEDAPHIIMEYIDGGTTLQSLVEDSEAPLEETRAAQIILDIARALDYSHRKGIIHRDIKASNIMMDGDTPKLTDFGLAFIHSQQLTRLTRSGELLGTLGYIAPELVGICRGKKYEAPKPESDLYSLGATFYELLTGKLPFQADSPGELILKILEKEPVSPAERGVKLSKDVEAICIKCLEKSVNKRYRSAAEMVADLERYLEGESVEAPRVNWKTRRIKREFSKRKMVLTTSFLTLLSIAALVVFTTIFDYQKNIELLNKNRGQISEIGNDYSINFLLKAMHDKSIDTRVSAIIALCRHDDELSRAALLEAVNDPDEKVKFHLATALLESSNPVKEEICEILLRESEGFVAAAAIRLAEQIDKPRLLPLIQKLSFSRDKVLRNYALKMALSADKDTVEFITSYLKDGHEEGKIELLNYMLKGRTPPLILPLIDLLNSSNSEEEKSLIQRILVTYTNADFGLSHKDWKNWWTGNATHWRARRCLIVTWAPENSKLATGDLIWSANAKEIPGEFDINGVGSFDLDIIRHNFHLKTAGPFDGNIKHRTFFIGTMKGNPTGQSRFIENLLIALAPTKS